MKKSRYFNKLWFICLFVNLFKKILEIFKLLIYVDILNIVIIIYSGVCINNNSNW